MKLLKFLAILFIVSGCTQRLTDFTIISTKNINLSTASQLKRSAQRTEGEDVAHIVFTIPFGRPDLKEAIDETIESIPGCVALLDGVVYYKYFYILVYGQMKYIVEGTPLIDPSISPSATIHPYQSIEYDLLGNKTVKKLSKEEYLAAKAEIDEDNLLTN